MIEISKDEKDTEVIGTTTRILFRIKNTQASSSIFSTTIRQTLNHKIQRPSDIEMVRAIAPLLVTDRQDSDRDMVPSTNLHRFKKKFC